MHQRFLTVSLSLLVITSALAATPTELFPSVRDTSFADSYGGRVLQQSVTIDAPASEIWIGLTQPAAYKKWNAPVSAFELRVGGIMEASYDPKAKIGEPDNIKNIIVAMVPNRLFAFRNLRAPKKFTDAKSFSNVVTSVELIPIDAKSTRVVETEVGYEPGLRSARAFDFFARNNAQLLSCLKDVYDRKDLHPKCDP